MDSSRLLGLVGHSTKSSLVDGTSFQSDIFAVDAKGGVVIFRQESAHTYAKSTYNVVPFKALVGVEDLGEGTTARSMKMISPAVGERKLQANMQAQIHAFNETKATRGASIARMSLSLSLSLSGTSPIAGKEGQKWLCAL